MRATAPPIAAAVMCCGEYKTAVGEVGFGKVDGSVRLNRCSR